MSRRGRDWTQMYAIYGLNEHQALILILTHATFFTSLSLAFLLNFNPLCALLHSRFPQIPAPSLRLAAGAAGSGAALTAACLFFTAANFFHSSLVLHWEMAQRMVNSVGDWEKVTQALDVGCGRGILLNAVAMRMKKEGSSGRVVGLHGKKKRKTESGANTSTTLRAAGMEGVEEYVTCREADARRLPFGDDYFDVVVSGAFVHTVGRELGRRTAAAAAERGRVVGEVVRVMKPGGVGVVWDLVHVPEYAQRLREMRMEEIRVSERVTAFMVGSHIVSFRKPLKEEKVTVVVVGREGDEGDDWSGRVFSSASSNYNHYTPA